MHPRGCTTMLSPMEQPLSSLLFRGSLTAACARINVEKDVIEKRKGKGERGEGGGEWECNKSVGDRREYH